MRRACERMKVENGYVQYLRDFDRLVIMASIRSETPWRGVYLAAARQMEEVVRHNQIQGRTSSRMDFCPFLG